MPYKNNYLPNEVNHYELSSRLIYLTENSDYTLTQINGQRIYRKTPHAWSGDEPSRRCEVFIGRIPSDCFEDTLVPLFSQAGELFEFRLMINFSGWNRGYAFAMYTNETDAKKAITMFNNFRIRPFWQLGVCHSINNCRIYISRIPSTTSSPDIVRLIYALTEDVQEVRIRRSVVNCSVIVEYKSHRGAAMARKTLVSAASATWGFGARPTVDWSLPDTDQLLKQYREVGCITPDGVLKLSRLPEEMLQLSPNDVNAGDGAGRWGETSQGAYMQLGAPSYTLEPWSQARRMRLIQDAQRNTAVDWYNRMSNNVDSVVSDMSSMLISGASAGSGNGLLNGEHSVWAPPVNNQPQQRGVLPSSSDNHAVSSSSGFQSAAEFNPWTAPHPLEKFIQPKKDTQ